MAYSESNPPQRIYGGLAQISTGSTSLNSAPFGVWHYLSADATNTVLAQGYFTNAQNLGMRQGDMMYVSVQSSAGSTGIARVSAVVQAVTSTGAAMGPATIVGAT